MFAKRVRWRPDAQSVDHTWIITLFLSSRCLSRGVMIVCHRLPTPVLFVFCPRVELDVCLCRSSVTAPRAATLLKMGPWHPLLPSLWAATTPAPWKLRPAALGRCVPLGDRVCARACVWMFKLKSVHTLRMRFFVPCFGKPSEACSHAAPLRTTLFTPLFGCLLVVTLCAARRARICIAGATTAWESWA